VIKDKFPEILKTVISVIYYNYDKIEIEEEDCDEVMSDDNSEDEKEEKGN
jgi:hypothetical protein